MIKSIFNQKKVHFWQIYSLFFIEKRLFLLILQHKMIERWIKNA